jgi:hypothetical protein
VGEKLNDLLKDLLGEELKKRRSRKDPHQVRDIVDFETWINDEYYSGAFAGDLFPYWREETRDFCDEGHGEWVITGSLGGGKSTAGVCAIDYRFLYTLSCYEHPQRLFGLGDIANLTAGILGPGGNNAEGFTRLMGYVDSSPYFNECLSRVDKSSVIAFKYAPLVVVPGSGRTRGSAVLSTDLFAAMLDEVNFYKLSGTAKTGDVQMAYDTYKALKTRRRSRFASEDGDPSFTILVSSVDHSSSFTEQRISDAQAHGEKQKVTITNPYITMPERFSSETFFVFKGSSEVAPEVMYEPNDVADVLQRDGHDSTAAYALARKHDTVHEIMDALPLSRRKQFLEMTETLRKDFESDVKTALKDLGGVSQAPIEKLFTNGPAWTAATSRVASLRHPFRAETVTVSRKGHGLKHFFLTDALFMNDDEARARFGDDARGWEGDEFIFRRHPYKKRYVHVDSSETTCPTGISMCHQSGVVEDPVSGLVLPRIEYDFILRIIPPDRPDKISHKKILQFFLWLAKRGVKFGKITYDQFASNMALEVLGDWKIPSERLAIASQYEDWKDCAAAVEDGRVDMYYYRPLKDEFFALDDNNKRREVTRNEDEWKDVSDSFVGAFHNCSEYSDREGGEAKEARLGSSMLVTRQRGRAGRRRAAEEMGWVVSDYSKGKVDVEKLEGADDDLDSRGF